MGAGFEKLVTALTWRWSSYEKMPDMRRELKDLVDAASDEIRAVPDEKGRDIEGAPTTVTGPLGRAKEDASARLEQASGSPASDTVEPRDNLGRAAYDAELERFMTFPAVKALLERVR